MKKKYKLLLNLSDITTAKEFKAIAQSQGYSTATGLLREKAKEEIKKFKSKDAKLRL